MRIAQFTNAYKPVVSGVVTSVEMFRRGLIEVGHDVHIFAPEHEGYQDQEPYVYRVPSIGLPQKWDFSVAVPIRNILSPTVEGIQPHVLHSHHPVIMGDLAGQFSRSLNVPLVFTFHSQYEKYAEIYTPIFPQVAVRITEEIVQRYVQRCHHLVVPSASIRGYVSRHYDSDVDVTVVPTPVDLDQFWDADGGAVRRQHNVDDRLLLLYVGRLAKEKRIDRIFRAFARLCRSHPETDLMLVGKGPHETSLREMAGELALSERVHFVGAVSRDEVAKYYASADIFLFASSTETQGLVILESMASGTPVVAVKAPGASDVLGEGGGILTDNDVAAFRSAIESLVDDVERRKRLGQEAAELARGYSIPQTTKRLLHAYEAARMRMAENLNGMV